MNYFSLLKLSQSQETSTLHLLDEVNGYVSRMSRDEVWKKDYSKLLSLMKQRGNFETEFVRNRQVRELAARLIEEAKNYPEKQLSALKAKAIRIINQSKSIEIDKRDNKIIIEIE